MDRPAFLAQHHESRASLKAAFRETSFSNRLATLNWLTWANSCGSMTRKEKYLFSAIEAEEFDL